MLFSYHLNIDALSVPNIRFRFGYFGSRNLGAIHVFTKFGLVLFSWVIEVLVRFASKLRKRLISQKNVDPIQFCFDSVFFR